MKIFTKGLLLIAVPGIFSLVLLAFLFQSQEATNEATTASLHSKTVLELTNDVIEDILNEAVRFRGALLSNAPSLAPDSYWEMLDIKMDRLVKQVADNPEQQRRAIELRGLVRDYRAALVKTHDIALAADPNQVAGRYRNLANAGALGKLRDYAAVFLNEEKRLDEIRARQTEDARLRQTRVMVSVVVCSMLLSFAVAWLFSKSVGARLSILTLNAQRLAERQALLPRVAGKDEIARLDAVMHEANERLALAEQREALAQAELRDRAHKLDELNQALAAQTQDNEMFVYSVSHDLRSPLVNLQGFGKEIRYGAQDLKDQLEASALPQATKQSLVKLIDQDIFASLNFLDSAVLRSAAIIDALLRLSRAGRVEYTAVPVDVQRVAERVVGALHGSLEQRGAKVSIGRLPQAWADATAVEQIFGNLVNNAVAYLDKDRPGEISIGALDAAASDVEDAAEDSHGVTYFVRDNGMGIPEHLQVKLFVAFQRLHGNASPGEGIGLALVRRVVDRNGGRIWVESTAGVGSTFFVTLPGVPKAAGDATQAVRSATQNQASGNAPQPALN